jgi:transposase-like protein
MTKVEAHEHALILRSEGKSYSQIRSGLNVSKSTLSRWLRQYPLSKKRISELRDNNQKRIEKYRNTMQRKRNKRLHDVYLLEQKMILPLSKKELYIAGLFLYWGEGNKASRNIVSIANTDPSVLLFALHWLIKGCNVNKQDIKVSLHLYKDMDIHHFISYWSTLLEISPSSFSKPYIKNSDKQNIKHTGFGNGTCSLNVYNTRLKEKIMMGIKLFRDSYLTNI